MVTDEKCEAALSYLAQTDDLAAHLKADLARREYSAKLARAREFLLVRSGSVEARRATAEVSQSVQEADSQVADAIEAHEKLKAKRLRAELTIEIWRTSSANRRHGNV